ncbi:reverse transcriptase [Blumeria hordei DH14]|uniref:Reverse transcriptase n=1 Tax=Blumeria graminis f. sp. hordei (strain DH14) TaxID=546991 RepID=N1JCM7_BLUG1|nr:reverse transcriptase [Blumeria hordei DH14]
MSRTQESLSRSAQTAADRASEGHNLFSTLALLLDHHCSSLQQADLPVNQSPALHACKTELALVVFKHFEAYVQGDAPPKAKPYSPHSTKSDPKCYSSAARSPTGKNIQRTKTPKAVKSDDRLFVRLPNNSAIPGYSGYALQTLLKTRLGKHKKLLSNVLPKNTGFAFCPSTSHTDDLAEKVNSVGVFGNASIERASPWASYRIENVPRNYGTLNENLQYCLQAAPPEAISKALKSAAGAAPIAIQASQDNDQNVRSPSMTWIVRFPDCAAAPRCSLCGSTQHTKENHGCLCAATGDHVCLLRCIHYHWPHPADSLNYPLRPNQSSAPKSKSLVSAIRKICADARLSAQAEAGCVKAPAKDILSASSNVNNSSTSSSAQAPSVDHSSSSAAKRVRLNNPFESLADEGDLNEDQMQL